MSTVNDILQGIGALVGSLDALLKTDTVDALITLVTELRIASPVKLAVDTLGTVLDKLVEWLGKLEQVAAVPRFLEVFSSPVLELGEGIAASGAELQEVGLSMLAPVADATALAVQLLEKARLAVRTVIQGVLPEGALRLLRESVQRLKATLAEYGRRLAGALALPAKAAGGTP